MTQIRKLLSITVIVMLLTFVFEYNNLKLRGSAEIFTSNLTIEGNLTNQGQPSIALDNPGNIYVVWTDNRNDLGDIYFAKSINGGLSFSNAKMISDGPGTGEQQAPSLAVDSRGIIHVVWEDWRNDADGKWMGSDGGIDGVNDADIYYSNSTNGGATWSPNKKINDDGGTTEQGRPDIDIDTNDVIHIVWEDRRRVDDFDIFYANSSNGGITFSFNKKINDVSTESRSPAIAIDEKDDIHIAWCDYRNTGITGPDIYYANSTDGGINFSSNKRVSDDTGNVYQFWPDIAANGGIIGIVWEDQRETSVYFAYSNDGGITFGQNKRVNDVIGASNWDATIAINGDGYICVAWEGSGIDIYFANSTDGGITFSPSQRVNDDAGSNFQRLASLAIRNRTVYISWQDDRNGNYDIYFSRSNYPPKMTTPISPPKGSTITNNTPTLKVTPVTDPDNDTIYYNFTISDQPDAESGTVYYSGWISSASWKPPPLSDGKWYWHTYTYDGFNITSPNWIWNFTIDTAQSYSIQLYKGWNLISIPFIQMDTSLESVLDSINGSYDAVQAYNASDAFDPWRHYQIAKPSHLNDLEGIDHRIGFWVHVTQPGGVLFKCSGIIPSENQSIALHKGWNLIGYPSLTGYNRTDGLNNINFTTEINAIWTYNTSIQKWEEIGPADYFELGRGYWIHAKVEKTWDIPL